MKNIKIAYIGGGSKMWARVFMNDLALSNDLSGEINLYDIDYEASLRNQIIGNKISKMPNTSKWNYIVSSTIDDALKEADFVILSILPGTFKEMESDVHEPNKYDIFQTVGDTVGPGGVLRAMRTVPMYEFFAKKIKEICPNAWVINFTNPMTICVHTLYDVFPEIKAFGCCHEVFHAQEFLAMVVKEELNLKTRPSRKEILVDVAGINHFTWFTHATYNDKEILPLITNFAKKHFKEGIYEGDDPYKFKYDTYAYGNKVKMDLYNRYGALPAAGDRHLVEFLNNNWYLKDESTIKDWAISITPVKSRIIDMEQKIKDSILMANGQKEITIKKSSEEAVEIIKALLGLKDLTTNVNYPNYGQIKNLPIGSIVESNCKFKYNEIELINSTPLPTDVNNLVMRNSNNIITTYEGIKERNLKTIFNAFINQPLCANLTLKQGIKLFKQMIINTKEYLEDYDIDNQLKIITEMEQYYV